jgi:hypothetical protein
MNRIIKKYGMLWIPSLIHRLDPKTHRRAFRMTCACGKNQWVRWNHFQQGNPAGCRSCVARLKKSGNLDPYWHSKHPIRQAWYSMRQQSKRSGFSIWYEWLDYEKFKNWSLTNGFDPGKRFSRKNWDEAFLPENCHWFRYKTLSDDILPVGLQNIGGLTA